jgi:hypothetical protein
MVEENFDAELFSSVEEQAEAEGVFGAGKALPARENPTGTFQVNIDEVSTGKSQSSDKLQNVFALRILVGPLEGKVIMRYGGLSSEKQVRMELDQLKRLGVNIDAIDSIAKMKATVLTLKDTKCVVNARQNGEFYNIYFQKAINQLSPETTEAIDKSSKAAPF